MGSGQGSCSLAGWLVNDSSPPTLGQQHS